MYLKRIVILLLTIVLQTTISFSQNTLTQSDSTVLVTSSQLKKANLIFLHRDYLIKENLLLNKQLNNYKLSNSNYVKLDSLKSQQISIYKDNLMIKEEELNNLNKKLKRNNKLTKIWQIGGISISATLLILLLIK